MRIRIHAMQFVCCDGSLGASSARDHGQRGPNAMAGVNQCSVDDRAKRSYRTKRMVFVGTARHNERGQLRWIVRLGNLGVRVFSRTPTARGAGRSGLAVTPLLRFFVQSFLDKPSVPHRKLENCPFTAFGLHKRRLRGCLSHILRITGRSFHARCLTRLNHYGATIVSAV